MGWVMVKGRESSDGYLKLESRELVIPVPGAGGKALRIPRHEWRLTRFTDSRRPTVVAEYESFEDALAAFDSQPH